MKSFTAEKDITTVEKDITTAKDILRPPLGVYSSKGLEDAKPTQMIRMQANSARGIRHPAAVEGRRLRIRAFVGKRAQHPARESTR